jgi:hypothetical protein
MRPLAVDLYCGLGGWAEGLLAEGWDVIGFDIEQHVYGEHRYPAQLVIQDVTTLHGSQFRAAALIVASPPCQAYSYADCAELRRLLATHPIPSQSPAHQPGDAVPPGCSAADRRSSLNSAGGASVSPALFGQEGW